MPPQKRKGSQRPVGMLAPATKKEIDKKIEAQRKALLAEQSGPTELLPRGHADFFTRMDATNVDDVPLTGLSQEDLAVICPGDGGLGTNRQAVRMYLRDRLARAPKPDETDAKEAKRVKLREDGELDLEFKSLGRAEQEAKWREALVIPGSCELAVGKNEFVKRTGGIGAHFWTALKAERAAAMADEARGRGDLRTSDRKCTHTAS